MASSRPFECSVCREKFQEKSGLVTHLHKTSPSCKTTPKKLDIVKPKNISKGQYGSETLLDAALVAAMEAGMERKSKPSKKSGLESSILSAIADGDDELVNAYLKMALNPVTGTRVINEKIINSVTRKATINLDRVADIIRRTQNICICFLLDTTGSMSKYISGVKEQIGEIVRLVQISGCEIEGLAFIGYKDWCDGENHFEMLSFTKSVSIFKDFVASICAKGGGDFPEDVIGGLNKAVTLPWPQLSGTRIIFHLADAPPHGKHGKHIFHDGRHRDDYPNGHPRDRPIQDIFLEMRTKKLNYYFGRINDECGMMISVFEKYYGQKIEPMDSTKVQTICSSVIESVMRSVSLTHRTDIPSSLVNKATRKFTMDEKEPNWLKLPRENGTVLTLELPETIQEITSFMKLQEKIKKLRLQIAPDPFSKGSIRLAYYGKIYYSALSKDEKKDENSSTSVSTDIVDDVVFKEIISLPKVEDLDRQRYITDLEVQTVAAKLAIEFNGRLARTTQNPNIKTKFLMTKVVRIFKGEGRTPRYLASEQRFRGESSTLVKYTNNIDFVLDPKTLDKNGQKRLEVAIAFSHFTHDVTEGYLLVCDLQGVSSIDEKGKETLLLTDPAIHCSKHLRFGKTNLSSKGINAFFKKHVCNKFCLALGLKMPS